MQITFSWIWTNRQILILQKFRSAWKKKTVDWLGIWNVMLRDSFWRLSTDGRIRINNARLVDSPETLNPKSKVNDL